MNIQAQVIHFRALTLSYSMEVTCSLLIPFLPLLLSSTCYRNTCSFVALKRATAPRYFSNRYDNYRRENFSFCRKNRVFLTFDYSWWWNGNWSVIFRHRARIFNSLHIIKLKLPPAQHAWAFDVYANMRMMDACKYSTEHEHCWNFSEQLFFFSLSANLWHGICGKLLFTLGLHADDL